MSITHTPGPWRWEFNAHGRRLRLVGGLRRYDLTLMDFGRWGMNGATMRLRDTALKDTQFLSPVHERPDWIAPEPGREHHKDWHQLLLHPDARLIEQAPTLLDALKFAEAALADIGDADREPGDDLAWCEARAAEALPRVRQAIRAAEGAGRRVMPPADGGSN